MSVPNNTNSILFYFVPSLVEFIIIYVHCTSSQVCSSLTEFIFVLFPKKSVPIYQNRDAFYFVTRELRSTRILFHSTSSYTCSRQYAFRIPDFLTENHVLTELDLDKTPTSKSSAGIKFIIISEHMNEYKSYIVYSVHN